MIQTTPERTPLEQPVMTATQRRSISIGLPANTNPADRRFPLTPEGAQMLVEQGFNVLMEEGAAASIHYTDESYRRLGVQTVSRSQALACNIVIYLSPLVPADIIAMRRGAMLLTVSIPTVWPAEAIRNLLHRSITAIDISLIADDRGNLPFADILAEIDGRAAMVRAASLLADSVHGKGILLGGVAGIVPCEVTIIGSGIAATAAARSALGSGAIVRMFDNDIYRLRQAERELGSGVITSALHPRVLRTALRTADVVVYTGVSPCREIDLDMADDMKRGVIVFDLTSDPGRAFPSLPTIDLAVALPRDISPDKPFRACYVNLGSSVARTVAMALSNTFSTMLRQILDCESPVNALRLLPGLQRAICTFMGKTVNRATSEKTGERCVDISLYLTLS